MTIDGQKRKPELYIYAQSKDFLCEAERLAEKMNTTVIPEIEAVENGALILNLGVEGLSLMSGGLSMRGDFSAMLSRITNGKLQHEMLVKAAKLKNAKGELTAIDATAGMGEDSMLLAAAGYNVTLYEYDTVIAELLRDALRRAKSLPELKDIAERMHLVEGDSVEAMLKLTTPVDLIYLDPMFPARQKSGLIKKKFQLLQKLEAPCIEEDRLLCAAMGAKPKRLVIKRPAKGPYIANRKPHFSLKGKSIRYDCFSFI